MGARQLAGPAVVNDDWSIWVTMGCICILLAVGLLTACAAPPKLGIYSQIAIISLPLPEE